MPCCPRGRREAAFGDSELGRSENQGDDDGAERREVGPMNERAEYALFSRREMDRRYARAQEAMTARGLDALLVTGEENFQYFTGTGASLALHYSLSRPNVLILPRRGQPVVLTQTKEYMTLSSYITEFREYFDVLHFPHKLVADTLEEVGLEHHR